MTAAAGASPVRSPFRKAWLLLAAVVVVIALVAGPPPGDGEPLDPAATGPAGAKALVLLLREYGAAVEVRDGPPVFGGTDVALLLVDDFGDAARDRLRDWVRAGGTLVVADPVSPFLPGAPIPTFGPGAEAAADEVVRPRCDLPAVSRVREVRPGPLALRRPAGTVGCFPHLRGFALVARAEGEGTVVGLAGAGMLVNDAIDEHDHGFLAVSLLAPQRGTRVAFLRAPPVGDGEQEVGDLIPPGVRAGLWQLGIAFVFFASWRARRLGRPVLEPQPVEIEASELVVATGHLLQQSKHRDQAAELLRVELRHVLCERLGLPRSLADEELAVAAAARTGVDVDELRRNLAPTPVPDERALVELTRTIERIRQEVVHAR